MSTSSSNSSAARRRLPALAAALGLSALLAVAGIGAVAAPSPSGLHAPIRAYAWPSDGPPNDALFSLQTNLDPIGVPAAWTRTTGTPSVIVAVLDSGIDAAGLDFAGRLVPGFNALTGVADTTTDFGPTNDDHGHGTHVSGTIAAAANDAVGIAGIAPGVSIMPVKVLDETGTGEFGDFTTGLDWAIAHGARIVSMSLGGDLDPVSAAVVQAHVTGAHAAGAVLVAAAGNSGTFASAYPCSFTYVICVGSTTNDGSQVSAFSTWNPLLALVAPGEGIASTMPGNTYRYGDGTSMATPQVSGAVALLRSVRPELSPEDVLAALIGSARPLVAGGHNAQSGFGLLQVAGALDLVLGPVAEPLPTPATNPLAAPAPVAPSVIGVTPIAGSRAATRTVRPQITFSVGISGVSTKNITLKDVTTGRGVAIRVSYNSTTNVVTILPRSTLAANHLYRITVVRVVAQAGGAPLARGFSSTFKTGSR